MWEKPSFQKRPDIALVKIDAEALLDDALKINAPPTHDAVYFAIRPGLDEACEFGQLLRRQARLGAFGPMVEKAFRAARDRVLRGPSGCTRRRPRMPLCAMKRPVAPRFAKSVRGRRERSFQGAD